MLPTQLRLPNVKPQYNTLASVVGTEKF